MKLAAWTAVAAALLAAAAPAQTITPTVGMITPSSATAGSGEVTLVVTGMNFTSGVTVWWNGALLVTAYQSPNQLVALVPSGYLASPGAVAIWVQTPDGRRSNTVPFTISARSISISTDTLPAGRLGIPYSAQLIAALGTPPYAWSIQSGSLPAGLALSAAGILNGTPAAAGTYAVAVRVSDAMQSTAVKTLLLTIELPAIAITTASPLPPGTVGVAYAHSLAVAGGSWPYQWAVSGKMPPGLALHSTTGVLSGTPTEHGSYTLLVRVTEQSGAAATKSLQLTIAPPPLVITTDALFHASVGVPYSQTFLASGGAPPYQWTLSGDPGALQFDANSGTITGTPQAAGNYPITIRVTDAAGGAASRSFTFVVETPRLNILNPTSLTSGAVGVAYSCRFSAVGGKAPYTWWIPSGLAPGLTLDAQSGTLSDVPVAPGTFHFEVHVADAGGQRTSKSFTMVVLPKPLALDTGTRLPPATVASPMRFEMSATGGVPPYLWSANGLPDGLELDAGGIISGIPKISGSFPFTVKVTDAARATAVELFRITIDLPALPAVTLHGLPAVVDPVEQIPLRLTVDSGFPVDLTGQLILSFTPDTGFGDGSVQFAAGGRSLPFHVSANSTEVEIPEVAIQTGTVAGSIQIAVRLQVGDADVTPNPAPAFSARVERAGPQIRGARTIRSASGVSIQITGFSTAREITQAVFRFKAAPGSDLRTREVTVAVEDLFARYFQDRASAQSGSQFVFTQPFAVEGDQQAVIPDSVTLTNRLGSATASVTP